MADANFMVAITSVACNRLILSLRGMGFTKGPIKAFDMFDNSGRTRLEGARAGPFHPFVFTHATYRTGDDTAELGTFARGDSLFTSRSRMKNLFSQEAPARSLSSCHASICEG